MKQRLKFNCWQCKRDYSLTREIEGQPKFIVACPFCGQEATVELAPYRSEKVEIFKGDTEKTIVTYDFPAVIPTAPHKE